MQKSPPNVTIAFEHAGLTHYGGAFFFHEFLRVLQIRHFLAQHLTWSRRNRDYSLSQMILALVWPLVLGLDRIETASLLRSNGTFQYLTGLPSFPDPQTLRRFLIDAPERFHRQLQQLNDEFLQNVIHLPDHRSRLIFDLDSTVLPVFGHQQQATIGYNPRYRGRRSYHPLLCVEANSSYLWDAQLRPGNASSWGGSVEMLQAGFKKMPVDIRELRARADSGFCYQPLLQTLEDFRAYYAVVARIYAPLKRSLPGVPCHRVDARWEMGELEHRFHDWPHARRFVVARRLVEEQDNESTLFAMGRYVYRVWVTNSELTPPGVRQFYDGRAVIEVRIRELLNDFSVAHIPSRVYSANALFLEIVRLAYNLVTAFQRLCLPVDWQSFTLQTMRHKLFLLPGELTRPHNRPVLRLRNAPHIEQVADHILKRLRKIRPFA
jgi:hypothetical protein